jgi:hypothetical protein
MYHDTWLSSRSLVDTFDLGLIGDRFRFSCVDAGGGGCGGWGCGGGCVWPDVADGTMSSPGTLPFLRMPFTWSRCYVQNFLRFSAIFGEKNWRFFSKTNVMKNANIVTKVFSENI